MEIKTILNRVQRHSLFVYGTVRWCRAVMRSQIDPMKKIARMLRGHRELLLNWFRAKSVLGQEVGNADRAPAFGEADESVTGFCRGAHINESLSLTQLSQSYGLRHRKSKLYQGTGVMFEPNPLGVPLA
jgi:hypothetical protein